MIRINDTDRLRNEVSELSEELLKQATEIAELRVFISKIKSIVYLNEQKGKCNCAACYRDAALIMGIK